jgi:hypothetical protein
MPSTYTKNILPILYHFLQDHDFVTCKWLLAPVLGSLETSLEFFVFVL